MARNTSATTETTETTNQPKRKFGVNTKNIPDALPTIPEGVYVGELTNAAIAGKNDKNYIRIEKETVWNKDAIAEKTGKKGAFVETGDYILAGDIYYSVTLKDSPDQVLPMDEMPMRLGRVKLVFDKDTFTFSEASDKFGPLNRVYKQFITATGVDPDALGLNEAVSYAGEEIEVPEELAGVPNIQEMLQYLTWYREYFNLVCEAISGQQVKVKVKEIADRDNPTVMVNVIDTGNYNSFSGILSLVEETTE